jgi:hypothetical protein
MLNKSLENKSCPLKELVFNFLSLWQHHILICIVWFVICDINCQQAVVQNSLHIVVIHILEYRLSDILHVDIASLHPNSHVASLSQWVNTLGGLSSCCLTINASIYIQRWASPFEPHPFFSLNMFIPCAYFYCSFLPAYRIPVKFLFSFLLACNSCTGGSIMVFTYMLTIFLS